MILLRGARPRPGDEHLALAYANSQLDQTAGALSLVVVWCSERVALCDHAGRVVIAVPAPAGCCVVEAADDLERVLLAICVLGAAGEA